jgi:WD domain, G-beta repeat
MKDLE